MLKILYAASNNLNARLQLSRFLETMKGFPCQIKIAAYHFSSPKGININWSLNAFLDIFGETHPVPNNDNLSIYLAQIKSFHPDLIISDLEPFTSYIAGLLNIPIWQCSSSLITYGLSYKEKYNLGFISLYGHFFHCSKMAQINQNLIDNADRNFVCSHYCDLSRPPELIGNFEWIRPYHQLGKIHVPCQHHIAAALPNNSKRIIHLLKNYRDCVIFMSQCHETYDKIMIKNIDKHDEFYCNLQNSDYFVCQGYGGFMADAFYNGKFVLIYTDFTDPESILNGQITHKLELGRMISHLDDIDQLPIKKVQPNYNPSVKYLDQRIKELL